MVEQYLWTGRTNHPIGSMMISYNPNNYGGMTVRGNTPFGSFVVEWDGEDRLVLQCHKMAQPPSDPILGHQTPAQIVKDIESRLAAGESTESIRQGIGGCGCGPPVE